MQREIDALIAAWRNERTEEERIFADVMLAMQSASRNRRAWLDDLADALRGYGSPAHDLTPPATSYSDIEAAIRNVKRGQIPN